jgi:ABC-type nickel/cobalt efflux system permease component RcnA
MKVSMQSVYYTLLLISAITMFGVGTWGMWQSNKRSKASDKKWDQERADMTRRTTELHAITLKHLEDSRREEHERHLAYLNHMKKFGPRKQPWEEEEN